MLAIIISLIINLFIVYLVYKKLTYKIEYPVEKEKSEINSLMIEFNKLTKNNIDLIEEKINEIKKIINLAEKKINEYKTIIKVNQGKNNLIDKTNTNDLTHSGIKIISGTSNIKKRGEKYRQIMALLKANKSPSDIAKIMGISVNEVNLYLEMNRASKKK